MASSNHQPIPWAQQGQQAEQNGGAMQDADRQMIRHLARKYTMDQLARWFEEEGKTAATNSDQASIASGSGYAPSIMSDANSIMSDEPASIFDSSSSVRSFSDTSSITGSIISNVSSKTARLLGRKPSAAVLSQQQQQQQQQQQSSQHQGSWSSASVSAPSPTASPPAVPSDSSSAPVPSAIQKQKGTFTCGFCAEEGIPKTCTRKNDLKRHIEDFHHNDAQWFCRHRGCSMVFDWQAAYKAHLKSTHGGSRMGLDEVKVNLCPQIVFACGFSACTAVFEASGDIDAGATFKEYVAHVVKHFDETAGTGEWSYNSRIRNLLRQSHLNKAWMESVCDEEVRLGLQWTPQSSGVLRKRLETRHIGDLSRMVQYAFLLGSGQQAPELTEFFKTPVRDECRMVMPGHKPRADVQAAASLATAAAAGSDVDSMQFRIPRDNNRSLAAYLASQRTIRAPARPHTSMRARPPPQMMRSPQAPPSSSHGIQSAHFFSPLPPDAHVASPTMFDPRNGYGGLTLMSPQDAMSMHGDMGMQGADVDMTDMSGMTSPYADTGFHSPLTSESCSLGSPTSLDHHGFYADRHAY